MKNNNTHAPLGSADGQYLLHAEDGGDGPDKQYPHLTEYQSECIQYMMDECEFAYEEHPIEAWEKNATDAGKRVEAAEHNLFTYVDNLLAERDAEISRLKAALEDMTGKRDWLKHAYDTVTGGTNPL